jgi:CubicO group peptidase (beta-lactamase class C family)
MKEQIDIKGFCQESFIPMREAFEANFTEGLEIGASLAVYHQDKLVLDLWGGFSDRESTVPWEENTIACVFSTTKIATILCTLMVIDRGLLDLDTPVAHYWPAFGKHGKDLITVRDVMTHRALIPGFAEPVPTAVMNDWEKMIELIENEKPWFEPGTLCYHPTNFGHILGELVRLVAGRTIREFFTAEVSQPLDADFHMGLTDRDDLARVALLTHQPPEPIEEAEEGSTEARVAGSFVPAPPGVDIWQTWERLSALIPAVNGHGNARSVARIGALLAMGGISQGRRYLSQAIIDEARSEQCHEVCLLIGDIVLGLGFGLHGDEFPAPTPECFHWGGYGGSWCVMDPRSGTSAAYVMNNCTAGIGSQESRLLRSWSAMGEVLMTLQAESDDTKIEETS